MVVHLFLCLVWMRTSRVLYPWPCAHTQFHAWLESQVNRQARISIPRYQLTCMENETWFMYLIEYFHVFHVFTSRSMQGKALMAEKRNLVLERYVNVVITFLTKMCSTVMYQTGSATPSALTPTPPSSSRPPLPSQ
jgi:hypothetical protein